MQRGRGGTMRPQQFCKCSWLHPDGLSSLTCCWDTMLASPVWSEDQDRGLRGVFIQAEAGVWAWLHRCCPHPLRPMGAVLAPADSAAEVSLSLVSWQVFVIQTAPLMVGMGEGFFHELGMRLPLGCSSTCCDGSLSIRH